MLSRSGTRKGNRGARIRGKVGTGRVKAQALAPRVRSGSRNRLLLGTALASTVLLASLMAPLPAGASECGSGNSVTCTSAGNPYAAGIDYFPGEITGDFTMVVEGDVVIASGANEGIYIRSDYDVELDIEVGSSRVDLQACKLEYSIVSPK